MNSELAKLEEYRLARVKQDEIDKKEAEAKKKAGGGDGEQINSAGVNGA